MDKPRALVRALVLVLGKWETDRKLGQPEEHYISISPKNFRPEMFRPFQLAEDKAKGRRVK